MKKFVLIAVLLQLCLSVLDVNASGGKGAGAGAGAGGTDNLPGEAVNETQLQFGDLLVFSDKKFSHYAVYVGNEHFEGKTADQKIFEMTDDPAGCRFHQLQHPLKRHNYLDEGIAPQGKGLPTQSKEAMIYTIKKLMQKDVCQKYSLLKGNCEQVATTVRYGVTRCKQEGTWAAFLATILPNPKLIRREASAAA